MLASADCVHLPVSVIVVEDVEESPPAPRHSLNQPPAEMIECDSDLHDRVFAAGIMGAEEHHLINFEKNSMGFRQKIILELQEDLVGLPHCGG